MLPAFSSSEFPDGHARWIGLQYDEIWSIDQGRFTDLRQLGTIYVFYEIVAISQHCSTAS